MVLALQTSARKLIRDWPFAVFAVVTLAIGVGVTSAVLSAVTGVFGSPKSVKDPHTLFFLTAGAADRSNRMPTVDSRDFHAYTDQQQSFSGTAAWTRLQAGMAGPSSVRLVDVEGVTAGYFHVLGVSSLLGRLLGQQDEVDEGGDVVVLSESVWRTEFQAKASAIGSLVRIAGQPFTVVGVTPAGFHGLSSPWVMAQVVWIPERRATRLRLQSTTASPQPLSVIVRLATRSSVKSALAELAVIGKQLDASQAISANSRGPAPRHWQLVPYESVFVPLTPETLFAFLAVPVVILLIASTNLANMTLSRGVARIGDLVTRHALGASRAVLIREQLAETVWLGLVGGALGLTLASVLVGRTMAAVTEHLAATLPGINLDVRVDLSVMAGAAAAVCAAILIGGLIPSYVLTKPSISSTLNTHAPVIVPHWRGRRNLIALQVGVTVWLFLLTQMALATIRVPAIAAPDGLVAKRLAIAYVPFAEQSYPRVRSAASLQAMVNELQTLPGVAGVAIGTHLPVTLPWNPPPSTAVTASDRSDGDRHASTDARLFGITAGTLEVLGYRVLSGRNLVPDDFRNDARTVLVNEEFARAIFGNEVAVGRQIYWRHGRVLGKEDRVEDAQIVGVIAGPPLPVGLTKLAFTATDQTYLSALTVAAISQGADARGLIIPLGAAIARADSALAVATVGRGDRLAGSAAVLLTAVSSAATAFALISLMLAMSGLYAVLSHSVSLRRRELALRMALGAASSTLIRVILRDGLRPVAEGVAIGILAALASRQVIQTMLADQLPPMRATQAAMVILAIVGVSFFVCATIGRRAATVDPNELLHRP